MKKNKQTPRGEKASVETPKPKRAWWPWVAALAGLLVALGVYGPALNGEFVLDDRYLWFMDPNAAQTPLWYWIRGVRPLLYFSFWLNYKWDGAEPFMYHLTNVILHTLGSVVIALITAQLLKWSGTTGRARSILSVIAGAVFLLHPLQTESVAYVASRSEVLSVLFYFTAFAIFLYKRAESVTIPQAVAIAALFGAALSTKEHTLTLGALLLLTDYYWRLGGIRKNALVYGFLAFVGGGGAFLIWRLLRDAPTAGFHIQGLKSATYFYTECRVIWTYVRLFFLPFGQNVDPDVAVSNSLMDHGSIFGLLGLIALIAAAWIYRKRWPLAAFGVFMFVLLLAPTSSFVPIFDVSAERRMYLPFLGLELVCLEFLRRLKLQQMVWTGVAIAAACCVVTYQRSAVWETPLTLWQDTVDKSPNKWRPRFQLAYAFYETKSYAQAVQHYEVASRLQPPDFNLLVDWAQALVNAGRPQEAIEKLRQAETLERSALAEALIGQVYATQSKFPEALNALAQAQLIDPRFEMTYVYRGNILEVLGDKAAALAQYQLALAMNPTNSVARDGLIRVSH